jgi:hypothetical protein
MNPKAINYIRGPREADRRVISDFVKVLSEDFDVG